MVTKKGGQQKVLTLNHNPNSKPITITLAPSPKP